MYHCTIIEKTFGKDQEADFQTLDDARDYARKYARIVPYKDGTMINEFYYYARISFSKCDEFLECIHPPS